MDGKICANTSAPVAVKDHRLVKGAQFSALVILSLLLAALLFFFSAAYAEDATKASTRLSGLTEMSIEELMNIKVTLASKKPEKYFDTPAAVYVITNEDIRRSGVTNIPDALRMAPGVEVARIDSTKWSVTIRGLGSELNRRVLVLMDGRSVYNPGIAGVYWDDAVDYPLEDIDRIEIVRGPGGSVWGTNAINGIINIITKNAKDTQGGQVNVGGGTQERAFGDVRYGGKMGGNANYRVYAKYFNRGPLWHADGNNYDDWQGGQAGFSTFWDSENGNTLRLQGDFYDTRLGQHSVGYQILGNADSWGGNILGRWQRNGEQSNTTMQFYYDHVYRNNKREPTGIVDNLDFQFQYVTSSFSRQEINCGLGYRLTAINTKGIYGGADPTSGVPYDLFYDPDRRNDNLFTAFAQDEIALVPSIFFLTIGSKFEHNDYSGYEIQPNARLLWKPTPNQSAWASVSRSARIPTEVEEGLFLIGHYGVFDVTFEPNKDFKSEELTAYEAGYRIQPAKRLAFDLTAYYNVYRNLLSTESVSPFPPVVTFGNKISGDILGGELSIDYSPFDWWKLHASQSIMRISMEPDSDSTEASTEVSAPAYENSSPSHQTLLRSYMDLPYNLKLDCTFRFVGRLPAYSTYPEISSYSNLDVRLAWDIKPSLEISLVGQNLLSAHHPEYSIPVPAGGSAPSEIERGVYGEVKWQW
ncbi:MAG: TonB-dependent receptor [Smithellaceae bacterium]|nr:TonB-dependent receptor [Smithellaceae bacterium]